MLPLRYYTLVASLPRLARFDALERLPITRERLDERLSTLRPDHRRDLARAESLVLWHRQPLGRSDGEIAARYRSGVTAIEDDALRDFVRFRMEQRTMLAGLRRRLRGEGPPSPEVAWGVEPRASWIRSHWDAPDFGLGTHYPWIGEASRALAERDALTLERQLMGTVWERLVRIAEPYPFGFEQVFGFVFRWDIARRWLAYEADAAAQRFGTLVTEALGEHQRQFA